MKRIIFICLLALSVNIVLIQTISIDNNNMKNIVRISVLILMMFFMLIRKRTISLAPLLLFGVSTLLLFISKNSDQLTFMFIFLFIPSLLIIETKKIEKYLVISSLISLVLVFVFLFLGLTHNETTVLRHRMNFGVNGGVSFFYNLVYGTFSLIIIYSRKYFNRYKSLITLMSLGLTTYLYIMTNARGGYFSFIILIILLYVLPKLEKNKKIFFFIGLIPEFFLSISFFEASLVNNSLANQFLSYRPTYIYNFYSSINFTNIIFSKSVKALDHINIVDNSYIHLLIGGGILIFLVIGYLFLKTILNLYKEKKYIEISFMISACAYFNMESNLVRIENMFVIYFWYLLFRYSLKNKKRWRFIL